MLKSTQAPSEPIRFDLEAGVTELLDGKAVYGLGENADKLAEQVARALGDSELW